MDATHQNLATSYSSFDLGQVGAEQCQRWFAVYTCPRHEKSVHHQLTERRIESFLPLYQQTHRWKDRRKLVELALFPGYVFVRMLEEERLRVLQLPGVVRFITHHGRPAPLEDREIESLRAGLAKGIVAEPHPFLSVGTRVRVAHGPMAGVEGILQRRKDKVRVVVSLEAITQSIALEVDLSDLELC